MATSYEAPLQTNKERYAQPPEASEKQEASIPIPDAGPDDASINDEQRPATEPDAAAKWRDCIHPDGWRYLFKVREVEPGVEYHEICGAVVNTLEYGGLHVLTYINHKRRYASKEMAAVIAETQHSPEQSIELRLAYWLFMLQYPTHSPLRGSDAVDEARRALHRCIMDGLRRKSDTQAPFTLSESKEILGYLGYNYEQIPAPPSQLQTSEKTVLVSWILSNVAVHHKMTRYGQKTFLEENADITSKPGILFTLISIICFFAPVDQRAHIRIAKKRSENRGDEETWPIYVETLVREWSTFNLGATVLLSASVGFLAIPGIDPTTRTITLLSVVFTLGSIMTSVYLLWRHQGGRKKLEYHVSRLKTDFWVDVLAIILSIPFASLAWGVIMFLVAAILYSFFGFQSTSGGSTIPIHGKSFVAVLISSIVVIVIMLVSFLFFFFFRNRHILASPV